MARPLAPRHPIKCTGITVHGLEKRAPRQTECRRFIASIFGVAMIGRVVVGVDVDVDVGLETWGFVDKQRNPCSLDHLITQQSTDNENGGVFGIGVHRPRPTQKTLARSHRRPSVPQDFVQTSVGLPS